MVVSLGPKAASTPLIVGLCGSLSLKGVSKKYTNLVQTLHSVTCDRVKVYGLLPFSFIFIIDIFLKVTLSL